MSNTTKHIEKFISHFDERIKAASALESSRFVADFRKTTYVAIIDGMSKSVFPRSGNRDRFVSFVEKFAKDGGFKVTNTWKFEFPLKASYEFHRRRIHRIKVSCFRIVKL